MNDLHVLWPGLRPVVYGALIYFVFLQEPLGRWLQQGFVRQDRMAQMQRGLFNGLRKLRLIPPIVAPNINVRKLTEKPLPQGLAVRLWNSGDLQSCLEIYRLNAPGRFPDEVEQEFAAVLEKNDGSMLVIESDGRVVACGGGALRAASGSLFYGLIHPEFQQRGLGRLLLLSRLARFKCPPVVIQICAVEASLGYYARFGFARYALWYSQNGDTHPIAGTSLHPENRRELAVFLVAEGYPLLPAFQTAG